MSSKVSLVWAQAKGRVIGKDNTIPWDVPEDFRFFKEQTTGGVVIMGRKTWESLPAKVKPLPGRVNIVLTNQFGYKAPGALVVHSVKRAVDVAEHNPNIYVIGGDQVYRQFIWYADQLIVTEVDVEVTEADAYAPVVDYKEWGVSKETHWADSNAADAAGETVGPRYRHVFYERLAKL
jgi:dihydrofolate reductase